MAAVKIKFAPTHMFLFGAGATEKVQAMLEQNLYTEESTVFAVDGEGQDAAEEVFDLTNNPGRQEEREVKYGRGRSLSVGDIVIAGEDRFVCLSMGWAKL